MDEINQVISRIPGWAGAGELAAERIAGLTNTNYQISTGGERFVLRLSGQNTLRLGINRAQEAAALQNAALAGIGPEVVAFLLPEGHLVTRWAAGHHWSPVEYRTPENVRLLTRTVQRVHAMPPTGAVFSPFRRVESFGETAQKYGVPQPADFGGFLATMAAVEAEQQADPSAWERFCHNDLVCVNYLYDERSRRITILDWEFSGLGDIYYDLAALVYTHDSDGPIPPELEEVLLECYFGEVTALRRRRLQGMKYMLMLFSGMWGLAQQGMQQAGLIPAAEGFDYLEFAEYLFTHDIPQLEEFFRNS